MLCRRFINNFTKRNFLSTQNKYSCIVQTNFTNKIEDPKKRLFENQVPNLYTVKRFKHKRKAPSIQKNEIDEDSDEEDENDLDLVEPHEKLFSRVVPSMRLDAIIKAGLGLSRNKVDLAFYESKIRLNEKKILKKSHEINEGDELDVVVGKSPDNSNFIVVHRIKVISSDLVSAGYKVKLVRDKSLVIEDYKDFKSPQ